MSERANPFADLNDFTTTPKKAASKPIEPAQIDRLAKDNGFPSRKRAAPSPPPAPERLRRRHVTGRNQQLNIKVTADTVTRFYRLADERKVTLGELFEQALSALEQTIRPTK